jgi:geranylgeranyl diphosphate synthase type I
MQNLRAEIEAHWRDHLEQHPLWRQLAAESPDAAAAVREVLLAPGKRLRPLLFALACRAAGREPFPAWLPVALALELAHSFILIHDDIIDRSAIRRNQPTLPCRIEALFAGVPADGFCGADFALVTGDLLYTLAIESLLNAAAPADQLAAAVRLFARAAQDTGRGALLEMRAAQLPPSVLTAADIEQIYALKTGRYTFALPLQLAALFSGAWNPEDPLFPEIGKHAGIAFQLENDREDHDDQRNQRRTWALVANESVARAARQHARRALDLAEPIGLRPVLELFLRADDPTPPASPPAPGPQKSSAASCADG